MLGVNKLLEFLQTEMTAYTFGDVPDKIVGLSHEERMVIGSWLIDAIKKSAKFDLGTYHKTDAEPLRLTGLEQIEEGILSMPFPYTYVELKLIDDAKHTNYWQNLYVPYDDISKVFSIDMGQWPNRSIDLSNAVVSFQFRPDNGEILIDLLSPVIGLDKSTGQIVSCYAKNILAIFAGAEVAQSQMSPSLLMHMNVLGIMLGLLTATGVEIDLEPAPERLNKARIAKGKLPAYEHHVVKIGGISSSGNIIGVGMDRASPRKHFRRGHTRTYHRGEDNEWKKSIPACVISGRGFVSKEYINDNMGKSDGKTKRS